ncbi:MAG: hypothetical protein ACJ78Q_03395, partial [Chloroflexia bacterium]
ALTVLVYPGLLFGVALVLAGEWTLNALRPSLTPRIYRSPAHAYRLLQPFFNFLKMAGRQPAAGVGLAPAPRSDRLVRSSLAFASALAPVLALALLPFPGRPSARSLESVGDLFLVLALLAAHPLCKALLRLSGDRGALRGALDLGRLVTGLFPILVAVGALLEASADKSLRMEPLLAAPETPAQALVRLLAGVALLVALPWWLDWRGPGVDALEDAGTYAGGLLQRAALAGFWAVVVLPTPGELPWAVTVAVGGTIAAYVALQIVSERWAPGAREAAAARLVWATSLPVAMVAMLAALLWAGA